MKNIICCLVICLISSVCFSQELEVKPVELKRATIPAEAVLLADADLVTIDPELQMYIRYIWLSDRDQEAKNGVFLVQNGAISTSSIPKGLTLVGGNELVRLNFFDLCPDEHDRKRQLTLFDGLVNREKYFLSHSWVLQDCDAYILNKITYHKKWVWVSKFGAHVDGDAAERLRCLTQSILPIMRYEDFVILSSTTLNGGIYYELVGIETNPDPKKGKTAEELFWESVGVDAKASAKLKSDRRIVLFKSKVTGEVRSADIFHGSGNGEGQGLGIITHDSGEHGEDAETDAVRNLITFKDQAREAIAERSNGFHIYAAFDSKGAAQRSVPEGIAIDTTIPGDRPKILQPSLSCMCCHGPSGGWQGAENQVAALLNPDEKDNINVFGDFNLRSLQRDQVERIVQLYAGNTKKRLQRGRDDLDEVIFKCTGQHTAQVYRSVLLIRNKYLYEDITPQVAVKELGFICPQEKAAQFFRYLMGVLPVDASGISREDPYVGALKKGFSITRSKWKLIYVDAAIRAANTISQEKVK